MQDDYIYWKATKHSEDWRQGKVLAVDNKMLFVKQGKDVYTWELFHQMNK